MEPKSRAKSRRSPSYATNIYGNIEGPVHTGSGDIVTKELRNGSFAEQELQDLRSELLSALRVAEYPFIATAIRRLQIEQLRELKVLGAKIEDLSFSAAESESLLVSLRASIESVQLKGLPPASQAEAQAVVLDIIDSPTLDAKHKLIITMPIIPFLLNYVGEFDVGQRLKLEGIWKWLKSKCSKT